MDPSREREWQSRWAARGLARATRDPGKEKFYAVTAYPTASGFLHVGHLRGFALADALHRYQRMRGRSVFFPMGTHASGLPTVAFAQKVKLRDPGVVRQLKLHEIPESEWAKLEDAEEAARFLGQSYLSVARRLGVLIDESAYLTTIDDDYRAFIQWQFRALEKRGVVRKGPYFASVCPVCGPVSVDPSETDLSAGGEAEVLRYTTIPFPLPDGRVLLAATLRPETVYGVTNLWIHPRESLVVWHHDSTPYLVSRRGAERLLEQHGGHLGHEVRPEELLGRSVKVPLANVEVPIIASLLVDPGRGSGVVMSVPGHAPADWLALGELTPEDRARIPAVPEIIFVPPEQALSASERELGAGPGAPAERAARATGAQALRDEAAREEATERLYRLEFAHGRMLVPALGPITVAEARSRMESTFEAAGTGFALQEFSIPVLCRNGHEVVIRRVPDQWFLRYSDPAWKEAVHALLPSMLLRPEEYRRELPGVIDWYEDRPCARRGRWLGTPLPQDPSWVIEPIADSTFYPAYYIVRRFVNSGRLAREQLTDALFDHVFLREGPGEPTVPPALREELRAEFDYWYPLDLNIGGKEHKRVHFPVFLFTHARLLPRELQPRGLLVHWWVVNPSGEKISKKQLGAKGGTPPVQEAFERWGADPLRLYYVSAASMDQDIEWAPEEVDRAGERVEELSRLMREALADGPGGSPELDAWLSDALHAELGELRRAFEAPDLRAAAQIIYVTLPGHLRRYLARGGAPGEGLQRVADAWVRLSSPITPHLAEELGEGRYPGLVAEAPYPGPEQFAPNPVARTREEYLRGIEEDLQSVLKPALARGVAPRAIVFYVAASWKTTVEAWVREAKETGNELLRSILARASAHPELSSARGEIAAYLSKVGPRIRAEPGPAPAPTDEREVLRSFEGYLARKFRVDSVQVHREEEADDGVDPMKRRQRARPGRPAFYLVERPVGERKAGASA